MVIADRGSRHEAYAEHSSFVKFVERNWGLGKLTARSRDNLPNPKMDDDNPYVPTNLPAIGDLFMFNFEKGDTAIMMIRGPVP